MSPPESFRVLGTRVDRLTLEEALGQIQTFLEEGSPRQVVTVNTLMCLEAEVDTALHGIIQEAALAVPESWGMLWASRRLGSPIRSVVPGIDLMLAICEMISCSAKGRGVFLLGSAPGLAEQAAGYLRERYPGLCIAGVRDGFFAPHQERFVIEMIQKARPACLFVGMGMPAQEKWIARNLAALGVPVVMGVGGSFDVLSGRLKRAPGWMRRSGIEWTYRLAQEPWRWRRIAQLPMFMGKVLSHRSKSNI